MERTETDRPTPTEDERARLIGEILQEFVVGLGRDRAMTSTSVVKIERRQRKAANDVGENANPPSPIDVGGIRGKCHNPRGPDRVDAAGGLSTEPPSRILPLAAAVDVGCRKSGEGIRMEMPLPVREGGISGRGARRAGGRGETGIHAACASSATIAASAFCSSKSLSDDGRVSPRFHLDGVVGSISARSQMRDMGMRCAFADAKRLSRGCSCSMFRQVIGISA